MSTSTAVRLCGRHLISGTVAWSIYPVCVGVVAVLGVVLAVLIDADPGGPLFIPASIFAAAAVGLLATVFAVFPAVVFAEYVTRKRAPGAHTAAVRTIVALCALLALCLGHAVFSRLLIDGAEATSSFVVLLIGVLPAFLAYMAISVASTLLLSGWRVVRARAQQLMTAARAQ